MTAPHQHLIDNDPILRQAFHYVVGLRANRRFARLADIDFFRIPAAVPHLFTMTVVDGPPQRFQFKFSGTEVDAILGLNPQNRYIDEIYNRPGHRIVKIYAEFFARQDVQISCASFTEDNGPARVITRLAIPLSEDDATITHVVGAMVMRLPSASNTAMPRPGQPRLLETFYIPRD
jgi:hypothetical protein